MVRILSAGQFAVGCLGLVYMVRAQTAWFVAAAWNLGHATPALASPGGGPQTRFSMLAHGEAGSPTVFVVFLVAVPAVLLFGPLLLLGLSQVRAHGARTSALVLQVVIVALCFTGVGLWAIATAALGVLVLYFLAQPTARSYFAAGHLDSAPASSL